MALEALTAKANTGAGTDQLAVVATAAGKAGAVALIDIDGNPIDAANPTPVALQGSVPLPTGAATEASLADLNAKAATELTAAAVTELLQEVCVRLSDIADSVGNLMPDTAGRIRVAAETLGTLSTITTVTTVGTVTTMANQTNIGGFAANQHIMALTQMAEQALRQNVVIS